jgi:hypothetical protein
LRPIVLPRIDAAIIEGHTRVPARERDPWAFDGAVGAIRAEPS